MKPNATGSSLKGLLSVFPGRRCPRVFFLLSNILGLFSITAENYFSILNTKADVTFSARLSWNKRWNIKLERPQLTARDILAVWA